jgi:sporulation protein YlmC with PRC-barrel domain
MPGHPPEGFVDDDENEVELHEGMQVSNEDGEELGTLSALLVEDDEEDAEFFLLKAGATEHLVPFDAVLGIGDGALVVDVTKDVLARYPVVTPGTEPSEADIEKAYDVFDETSNYSDE